MVAGWQPRFEECTVSSTECADEGRKTSFGGQLWERFLEMTGRYSPKIANWEVGFEQGYEFGERKQ